MAKLIFNEERHEYSIGGVILPSVTEICRFLTMDVAEGANKEMRDAAAERGTRIHEACTMHDFEGDECEVDGDIVGYVEAYAAFKRDYKIAEWLLYEHPMGSLERFYAGTLDRICYMDGSPTIIDIKSGTTVNKLVWAAQLKGYELLLRDEMEENHNDEFNPLDLRSAILKLKKDGKYTLYRDLPHGEIFFKCNELMREIYKIGGYAS